MHIEEHMHGVSSNDLKEKISSRIFKRSLKIESNQEIDEWVRKKILVPAN